MQIESDGRSALIFSRNDGNSCLPEVVPATLLETMPKIIIKTGLPGPDGREEELMEFMCDVPGCPNVASNVLGRVPGLGLFSAVCQEHLPAECS